MPRSITASRATARPASRSPNSASIATADKVKPVLVKRPLGKSDPAAAHKGVREAYIGGRWHKADLYEMDLLQPGHEVDRPGHHRASRPRRSSFIRGDRVFVDEWTLLHYTPA